MPKQPDRITDRARRLRSNMVSSEARLWEALRKLRASGIHVRRQAPVLGFFVDFYCAKARLALEVDGTSHTHRGEYDAQRDLALANHGIHVTRVSISQVSLDPDRVALGFADECRLRLIL